MTGSIANFWAKLNDYSDVARSNRFEVFIDTPQTLLGRDTSADPDTAFSAESTELPGKSLNVFERKDHVITEKMPMQTLYSEITINFLLWSNKKNLVDSGLPQKRFFDDWMQTINYSPTSERLGNAAYLFNYKNNYSTKIRIKNYDVLDSISHEIVLIDAFPISVGSVGLNWADDGVMRLPVTFAYTRWYRSGSEPLPSGPYGDKSPSPGRVAQTITEINERTGLTTISQVDRPGDPNFVQGFVTRVFPTK